MPFTALDSQSRATIDITCLAYPRQELEAAHIICRFCEAPMIIRAGLILRPHFAHRVSCTSPYASHPESPEHLVGKFLVAERLRQEVAEYSTATIEFEVPIPEVQRIADIMVIFPNGWRVAHEIQLASITSGVLQQRTEDYRHAGVDVEWWLGKSADTPANRAWCEQYFGYALSLNLVMLASGVPAPGAGEAPRGQSVWAAPRV